VAALAAPVNVEIRGPFTRAGVRWTVYVDGWPAPGFIELDPERADRYRVQLGRIHGKLGPPFATLEEAAEAPASYHLPGRAER
jgi:hypothetical protein